MEKTARVVLNAPATCGCRRAPRDAGDSKEIRATHRAGDCGLRSSCDNPFHIWGLAFSRGNLMSMDQRPLSFKCFCYLYGHSQDFLMQRPEADPRELNLSLVL